MSYNSTSLTTMICAKLQVCPSLTLSGLSRELGIDRHTIAKAIRLATGKSYRNFQDELAVKHISYMLIANPDRSIKEIGVLLGYKSSRAFQRFTRQVVGKTPTQLRSSLVSEASTTREKPANSKERYYRQAT